MPSIIAVCGLECALCPDDGRKKTSKRLAFIPDAKARLEGIRAGL